MEWIVRECVEAAGCPLEVCAAFVGEDVLVCLQGGDGSVSVTSSVLNYLGHKDEVVCRYVAEKISRELKRRVVCTGGFHKDGITVEEIREVQRAAEVVTEKVRTRLAQTDMVSQAGTANRQGRRRT